MRKVFISYQQSKSGLLAQLIRQELKARLIDSFVDLRDAEDPGPFPRHLHEAIANADVFICLLADTTLESKWVKKEIKYAYTLNKIMIPIFQENYKSFGQLFSKDIQFLIQSQGIEILESRGIYILSLIHIS